MTGGTAERGRFSPFLIFIMLWNLLVYVPVVRWTWHTHGWLHELGVIDCAGGIVVHICAGTGSAAYSWALGMRLGKRRNRPHNTALSTVGVIFFWIGTTASIVSSTTSAMRAVIAVMNATLSTCTGALLWSLLDAYRFGSWSLLSFNSGVVAGLVAISSGASFVPMWASLLYGTVAGAVCYGATRLKHMMISMVELDDEFDVFALHVVGGAVGGILTAFFAT